MIPVSCGGLGEKESERAGAHVPCDCLRFYPHQVHSTLVFQRGLTKNHAAVVHQLYEQVLASLHAEPDRPEDTVLSETEKKEDAKVAKQAGSGGGGARREKKSKGEDLQAAMLQEMKQTNVLLSQLVEASGNPNRA
jgi:hypothetical protein